MVCDIQCQRDKKLKLLQSIYLDSSKNPEAYEQAKINYFSFKNGPEWLHKYKQQKAEQESEQVARKYRQKQIDYERNSTNIPVEDDYSFNDNVQWRLFELENSWTYSIQTSLIIIFSLIIVYQIFSGKLLKIMNYFKQTT
jgi:hypothetical protein